MSDWYVSSAAWTAIAQFATGSYTVGQIVRPLTAPAFNAQFAFRCTTAGSASAEPAWPAANNGTVTATGGAVFTNVTGQAAYGWSAAAGNLYAMTVNGASGPRPSVGDRVFLSSDHSESSANTTYQFTFSAGYGVMQFISVNRAGSVPPAAADALSGAAITSTSGSTFTLDPWNSMYWQGITFTMGGTASGLQFSSSGTKAQYFKNCAFALTTSTPTASITTNACVKVTWDNTTVSFNAAGQRFLLAPIAATDFQWINTPAATLGTVPTVLFSTASSNQATTVTCRGVDLSAITTTLCYGNAAANQTKALFDSCRIASGVARLGTASYTAANDEIELVNCYDGTHFVAERHTPAGDVTTEFSTTMVGGAQDDVGLFSHKMVSSSRADPWAMLLDGFWMDVENTLTGSARTATVEIVSSASLNNNDITLVLEYQGTAGSSLARFTNSLASPLTTTAALPTSSVTWNNPPATPVKQHIQVTFTPQQAGRVRGYVRLGKASTTVWINPQIIIA